VLFFFIPFLSGYGNEANIGQGEENKQQIDRVYVSLLYKYSATSNCNLTQIKLMKYCSMRTGRLARGKEVPACGVQTVAFSLCKIFIIFRHLQVMTKMLQTEFQVTWVGVWVTESRCLQRYFNALSSTYNRHATNQRNAKTQYKVHVRIYTTSN
jgi:hypothetical protein